MPWQTIVHTEPQIIETRYSGYLSADELLQAIEQTIGLVQRHGILFLLGDCSRLLGGHDVTDLRRFADVLSACDFSQAIREAIIVPEVNDASGLAYFWTYMTQMDGLIVKPFEDRQSAIEWLTK